QVFDVSNIPAGSSALRAFVLNPLPWDVNMVVRCFIDRDRSGTRKFFPVFTLYADLEDGSGRLLLAARKVTAEAVSPSKTAHYIICMRRDDLFKDQGKRGGASFLGKLRATGSGSIDYTLYDG
ncbi:unnamed protein product, partial [Discosporangium mesarthrocarpum]